jgi:uroporphyrinogen-III synthase
MRAPVIVTRPAAPGRRLTAALRRRGCEVAWWPAFDIAPPANEVAVRQALDHLADYDLALFVSPNAVHATAWTGRPTVSAVPARMKTAPSDA